MTHDTFNSHEGNATRRGPVRRGRLAARVRSLCILLCCAMALQPSLLIPVGGRARATTRRPSADKEGGPQALITGPLLANERPRL